MDGQRTIGINVIAPPGVSLQQAMRQLETEVDPAIRPLLPPDGGIRYAGDAGSLETALADMRVNITLALFVLFLLMAALFRSLRDSALVLLTVPLASLGGVLGIRLLNLFTPQTLDMLTMVGFIILLGAAVNNAILLVESARVAERGGMSRRDSVRHALEERTRPIFLEERPGRGPVLAKHDFRFVARAVLRIALLREDLRERRFVRRNAPRAVETEQMPPDPIRRELPEELGRLHDVRVGIVDRRGGCIRHDGSPPVQ